MAAFRCNSPCPDRIVSPSSASWCSASPASSSSSFSKAPDRRTSSRRSTVVIASANSCGGGAAITRPDTRPPSTAPVCTPSSLPRATISPAAASAIFTRSPSAARHMPPIRLPSSVAPSFSGPHHTRAQDSLPPWPAFSVRKICTKGSVPGATPCRAAVASGDGASWRSAFHRRRTPPSRSALPSRISEIVPPASSAWSRSKISSLPGLMSSMIFSSSPSSKSARASTSASRASRSRSAMLSGTGI